MIERYLLIRSRWQLLFLLLAVFAPIAVTANGFVPEEISLKGFWKFRIGDDEKWSASGYDDADWAQIRVPARWEDVGYEGYDGIAWYRTAVTIPPALKNHALVLRLGYIDDADEVFVNGVKIGQSGTFPPDHVTAYNALRSYQIPNELLNFGGKNIIAVRVYDSHLEGGIKSGDVKIFVDTSIPPFDINLSGEWMFNKGRSYEAGNTVSIHVPGAWENQGLFNYDGFAVYSRKVKVPAALANQRLVLIAGIIDDVDQLVINGQVVGQTGEFGSHRPQTMYRELRNYFIPPGVFKAGVENLIEIRIQDTGGEGGIVKGPVGIITQERFRQYWRTRRK
ncbi:MAG: beta galactosidase jelly roll domain-containing protein [Prolixibacteraceae bacterium]